MTARCQLCGVTITGRYVAKDATERELLMEYDNLSAHMWIHISDFHRDQMAEGITQQQRAAKMYAMNWADHTETMILIKQEWRKHMLIGMTVTTRAMTPEELREGQTPAPAGGAVGSNEKNEARNKSN
jgi:hypothetical protein